MKKPILYVQCLPENKNKLAFDFCYYAKLGAEQYNISVKPFKNSLEIPGDPTNIVVGSVEMCSQWLSTNGYSIPKAIDLEPFNLLLGRSIKASTMSDFREWFKTVDKNWIAKHPTFIKPRYAIKAFTGFAPTDELTLNVFSEGYDGPIWMQEPIDIVSEYRLYVSNHKPIGMKHYSGDCLVQPSEAFIKCAFEFSKKVIDYHSYTLDFGVLTNGYTVIIEANDAWAVGNYGLEPSQYYLFVRNRWLQMTGVRTKMDGVY